jgi:hypothetical protein
MAPKTTSQPAIYPYPYQQVFDAIVAVLPAAKMNLTAADPATGTVWANTPMSLAKWGEKIVISVWQPQPGHTGVSVTSELSFGIGDPWGINRRNIGRLFDALTPYLDHHLAPYRAPLPPQAPPPPAPPPQG